MKSTIYILFERRFENDGHLSFHSAYSTEKAAMDRAVSLARAFRQVDVPRSYKTDTRFQRHEWNRKSDGLIMWAVHEHSLN